MGKLFHRINNVVEGLVFCSSCLKKQREIDRLEGEIKSLKAKLRYRENKEKQEFFGSSYASPQCQDHFLWKLRYNSSSNFSFFFWFFFSFSLLIM